MMKTVLCAVTLCLLWSFPAAAQQQGFQSELIDKLAGDWVMTGTIGGSDTVHDLSAAWVLDHQYLRFHEVAREQEPDGTPLYEAIVFIGWDQPSSRYSCLWLDSTGGGGLSAQGIGHAKPSGDDLPFIFDTGEDGIIHNTFAYDRAADIWRWRIDVERGGKSKPFARVELTRKQH